MSKFIEKTLKTTEIFKGKMIDLQVDEVELPNGEKSTRELVKHPGAVAVIALTPENKLVLVEQFRKPLEKSILEIPAGKIDPNEDPITTARRELEEETGYQTENLEYITSFYTSPGFANEILYVYIAKELTLVENRKQPDEDEFVEVVEVDLNQLNDLEKQQRIHDVKTIYAIQYLKLNHI